MTASDALALLLRLTFASSLSILLVLLLRRPLRALFGAGAGWQFWLLVPAAMFAAALPSIQVQAQLAVTAVPTVALAALTGASHTVDALNWSVALLAAWLAGAGASAAMLVRAQRRFVANLGVLTFDGGIWYAAGTAEGPALLGLRMPRIVVPADFERRYDPCERSLIIAHERRHAERRDPVVNMFIALLRCLFWFNPLMHLAATRCRIDQELACDADVMRRRPGNAKAYAKAMLKTQVGGAPALATCHWQSSHPLKERIMNLNQPLPARSRRIIGRLLLASLLCGSATAALVARADTAVAAPAYEVEMQMESQVHEASGAVKTVRFSPHLLVDRDKMFAVRTEQEGVNMDGQFWIGDAGDGKVSVRMKLHHHDKLVGEPSILAGLGETSSVALSPNAAGESYKVTLTVKLAGKGVPQA